MPLSSTFTSPLFPTLSTSKNSVALIFSPFQELKTKLFHSIFLFLFDIKLLILVLFSHTYLTTVCSWRLILGSGIFVLCDFQHLFLKMCYQMPNLDLQFWAPTQALNLYLQAWYFYLRILLRSHNYPQM